jgi:hypothetical protein
VPDYLGVEDDLVQVAFQTWALCSKGRTILVDTGIGKNKTRPAVGAWDHLSLGYLENLAMAGIEPEDVDLVINTHLHVDYVGWNTRLADRKLGARLPERDLPDAQARLRALHPAKNPNIADGVNENAFGGSIEPVHVAGQIQLWEGEHVVDGNLRLPAAPGHTLGASRPGPDIRQRQGTVRGRSDAHPAAGRPPRAHTITRERSWSASAGDDGYGVEYPAASPYAPPLSAAPP